MKFNIYTDGACRGNGKLSNVAAYGYIAYEENSFSYQFAEKIFNSTNNICELKAVIKALEDFTFFHPLDKNPDVKIVIYTDSKYVQQGVTDWMHTWAAMNWRKVDKKPVKNVDLWKKLYDLYHDFEEKLEFEWVKGHFVDGGNIAVDKLINKAMDKKD